MGGRISPYSLQDDIAKRLLIRVILVNSYIFSNNLSNLASGNKERESLPSDSHCRICFVGQSLGCALLSVAISATGSCDTMNHSAPVFSAFSTACTHVRAFLEHNHNGIACTEGLQT